MLSLFREGDLHFGRGLDWRPRLTRGDHGSTVQCGIKLNELKAQLERTIEPVLGDVADVNEGEIRVKEQSVFVFVGVRFILRETLAREPGSVHIEFLQMQMHRQRGRWRQLYSNKLDYHPNRYIGWTAQIPAGI